MKIYTAIPQLPYVSLFSGSFPARFRFYGEGETDATRVVCDDFSRWIFYTNHPEADYAKFIYRLETDNEVQNHETIPDDTSINQIKGEEFAKWYCDRVAAIILQLTERGLIGYNYQAADDRMTFWIETSEVDSASKILSEDCFQLDVLGTHLVGGSGRLYRTTLADTFGSLQEGHKASLLPLRRDMWFQKLLGAK